jgi:predicted choloylglycine hydrolase
MAYNITLADPTRGVATVHVGPGRPAWVTEARAATNHQQVVEWRPYCDVIHSEQRLELLDGLLDAGTDVAAVAAAMLREPLYATKFQSGFGTLYTAVARPEERTVTYHWPGRAPWTHTLDQPRTDEITVVLNQPHTAPTPA